MILSDTGFIASDRCIMMPRVRIQGRFLIWSSIWCIVSPKVLVGIREACGSFWDRFDMVLEWYWVGFGLVLGSSWDVGIVFGRCWGGVGMVWGSV